AWPNVPRGWRNDLVVADLPAFDVDPVTEGTTRRLRRAPAASVALDRLDVPRIIEAKLAQRAFGLAIKPNEFVHSCEVAEHHACTAELAVDVEHQRIGVLPRL